MINISITSKKINCINISMQTKVLLTKICLRNYLRKYKHQVLSIQTFKTLDHLLNFNKQHQEMISLMNTEIGYEVILMVSKMMIRVKK